MAYGKSIELFLVNGSADSLIIAELSNWNGKAIKIPRIEVADCKRDDINGAGVYFLFCKEEDDTDSVYIGESETVQDRLIQHIRDYNAEKEKFYWTTAVIFLGRDLNKALIRYLEDRFVQIARECKRYNVLTKNTYSRTVMKEVLAPGENRHFEPGENSQFQPGRNRQSVPGGCSQPRFGYRF